MRHLIVVLGGSVDELSSLCWGRKEFKPRFVNYKNRRDSKVTIVTKIVPGNGPPSTNFACKVDQNINSFTK